MESTSCYTFTPCVEFVLLPLAYTPYRGSHRHAWSEDRTPNDGVPNRCAIKVLTTTLPLIVINNPTKTGAVAHGETSDEGDTVSGGYNVHKETVNMLTLIILYR